MKRYDPKMHSAEHILNQTMIRLFESDRCFSAHIEKKKSKCDYYFTRPLSKDEITCLEEKINQVIREDLPVTEEYMSLSDANSKFNLSKLPNHTGNIIRIVKVGNYDTCPCIGDHVRSTGEIGHFRITSTDFNDGILRIRYKLG